MVPVPARAKHSILGGVPGGHVFGGYLTGTSAASMNVPESASGPLEAPDGDAAA